MMVFVLIAKGWTITREYFGASEWRGVIVSLSVFYMTNSIILVLQSTVLSVQGKNKILSYPSNAMHTLVMRIRNVLLSSHIRLITHSFIVAECTPF